MYGKIIISKYIEISLLQFFFFGSILIYISYLVKYPSQTGLRLSISTVMSKSHRPLVKMF